MAKVVKFPKRPKIVQPDTMCSICGVLIPVVGTWTKGNNAAPINDGRCCNDCNHQVVLPLRLARLLGPKEDQR